MLKIYRCSPAVQDQNLNITFYLSFFHSFFLSFQLTKCLTSSRAFVFQGSKFTPRKSSRTPSKARMSTPAKLATGKATPGKSTPAKKSKEYTLEKKRERAKRHAQVCVTFFNLCSIYKDMGGGGVMGYWGQLQRICFW